MITNTKFLISQKGIIRKLLIIWFLLLLLHLTAVEIFYNQDLQLKNYFGITEDWQISIFDLDTEESFGTYFSLLILLIAGLLFLFIQRNLDENEKKWRVHWNILGIGFCFMSTEEIVGIHEWINTFEFSESWTTFVPFILIPLAIYYLPFLKNYKGKLTNMLILSAVIYLCGAVVVERYNYEDTSSLAYSIFTLFEEGFEMLGVIILINTLLDQIKVRKGNNFVIEFSIDT